MTIPFGSARRALSSAIALAVMVVAVLHPAAALAGGQTSGYKALGILPGTFKTTFSFAVASDSHAGYGPADENTARAFQDMASRHPDLSFLVHMGDVTETGAEAEYRLFRNAAASLPFPVMATVGNHEARWQDPQGSVFKAQFSAPNLSFDYGAWHFLVLDTTYPGETLGTLDPATVSWLEKDLLASRGRPVAVFSHHPFLYSEQDFQDSDDAFAELLDRYPVAAVFCGHGHSFISWLAQGRRFQMVGALMDGAYAVVEVQGASMSIYSVTRGADGKVQESLTGKLSAYPLPHENPLSSSPVTSFSAAVEGGRVSGKIELSRAAQVSFQIDRGSYNPLGELGPGSHQFTQDVSGHAKGTHSIRLKAVAGGISYFASGEFDKDASDITAWRLELGSAVVGDLLRYGQDRVILGTRDGAVRCVDLKDGRILWQFAAGSAWGGGVLDGDMLYFGTAAGDVCTLDADDGSASWRASLDKAGFFAAPAIALTPMGKLVIAGSSSGKLYALYALYGGKAWQFQAKGAIASAPAVSNGKAFFGAWDGSLSALDTASGSLAWSAPLGRQIYYSPYLTPAVSGDTVFATAPYDSKAGGSLLYALDASTGWILWKAAGGSSFMEPAVLSSSQVSVLDASGDILVFSQVDGRLVRSISGEATLFATLAMAVPSAALTGAAMSPGAGPVYVTGGYRGVLTFVTPDGRADYRVRDSYLFVSPILVTSSEPGSQDGSAARPRLLTLAADTRGRVTALAFPR